MYFKQINKKDDKTLRNLTANENRNLLKRIISQYKSRQSGNLNKVETIVDAFMFLDSIPEKWGFPDFEVYAIEPCKEGEYVAHHASNEDWSGIGHTHEEAIIAYVNELIRRGVKTSA